ncbi:hypothetical protein [Hymenobacter nivis]|uniref:Uncharacterized protein n=1 Tax=Hymenobacter nivis TaxID=1850093 RepID=A0A2Z3GSV2_9BACT|nr:hypothetical protein [Hymenobacter nivis]AWM34145.1 hypothetical protein DDQ68_15950 [Hymenobacter nivis]
MLGLVLIRTEASHQQWDFPSEAGKKLLRTITIRDKDKDIPMLHMHTNLSTLELSGVVTREEFNKMLAEQANPKAAKAAARKRKNEQ